MTIPHCLGTMSRCMPRAAECSALTLEQWVQECTRCTRCGLRLVCCGAGPTWRDDHERPSSMALAHIAITCNVSFLHSQQAPQSCALVSNTQSHLLMTANLSHSHALRRQRLMKGSSTSSNGSTTPHDIGGTANASRSGMSVRRPRCRVAPSLARTALCLSLRHCLHRDSGKTHRRLSR